MALPPLPPYFRIDPDGALQNLPSPSDSSSLQQIAQACRTGIEDLVTRGFAKKTEPQLRLFSTWEITRYLLPVAPAHLRRVLRANPDLPQGYSETEGAAKWFTLDEVLQLRTFFGTEGSKAKEYLPYRPSGLPAKITAVANVTSSVGKTSTVTNLAMSAALDGYRVLVIDLDPQGALTSVFGGQVKDEWQTVFPLLARHYATFLRQENQRRQSRGDIPIPLDGPLGSALAVETNSLIQPTHWPNIDVLGAQLDLHKAEFQMSSWRMQGRGWKLWDALGDLLRADGVLDTYDVVLLDTPPALGYLSINGLAAADIVLVPLGACFDEFDDTARFFDMMHTTFQSIEEGENQAARALGQAELAFRWDAVRAIVTRYDSTQHSELAALMQSYMGRTLSPQRQHVTPLIGPDATQVRGIYEADYRASNREIYSRGRESFDETYAIFKSLLLGSWRRDVLARDADAQPTR